MIKLFKAIFSFRSMLVFFTICSSFALILTYLSPFVHPKTISFLPFFGLSYILILFSNITLLVFWIFLKSRWSLFILSTLIIGGNIHFRTIAIGSDDFSNSKTELTLMSYNVRLFDLYNRNPKSALTTRNKIFNYLSKESCDVTCFQEFYHQDKPTKFITKDTLVKIMGTKDYHERYAHKYKGRQNFGVTILSKYPMIEKGNVNFSVEENNFNYCIYADIVKNKDTFRVYNVHLQSIRLGKNDYALFETPSTSSNSTLLLVNKIRKAFPIRANQAEQIIKHIDNAPYPAIVCGDFNDTPMSYVYNQFSTKLTDAFRNTSKGLGITYAGKIPAGRIDYIFHSKLLSSKAFNIQSEKLSDHFAIRCTVYSNSEE